MKKEKNKRSTLRGKQMHNKQTEGEEDKNDVRKYLRHEGMKNVREAKEKNKERKKDRRLRRHQGCMSPGQHETNAGRVLACMTPCSLVNRQLFFLESLLFSKTLATTLKVYGAMGQKTTTSDFLPDASAFRCKSRPLLPSSRTSYDKTKFALQQPSV